MKSQPPVFDKQSNSAERQDAGEPLTASSSGASSRRAMTMSDLDIETIQWLSDDLREGFALFDPEDRLVVANPEYHRLHDLVADILKPGITFEAMIRTMVARGAVSDAIGDEEAFIATRLQQHRNPVAPVLRRLADGRAYIIKETRLPDGTILCRENDVTELVSAKEALRESEERFKALAEIASDWFWETDAQHRFTSITEAQHLVAGALQGILGRTRWELVGADSVNDPHWAKHKADLDARRPFKDFHYTLVPSTGMSTHFRVSGSAVFNKAGLAIGYRTTPKDDGGRRHFSVSGVPIFDRNGRFAGYRGTSREITKEILTERRGAVAHQRLLDAIEAMPESVLLCDAEGRVVLCNSATYTRLPWCKTLIEPGMKFEDVLRDIAFTGKIMEARGREEAWVRENLERHRAADGSRQYRRVDGRWVEITERKTADGGTVVIRADITEKKQRELEREAALTQAREANRAKSTFLATFTHELRTPVGVIKRMAEKLRRGRRNAALTAAQKTAVQSIEQAVEQTLRLVDDVLDIARIQVHRYAFNPRTIDVAGLVRGCCAEAAEKAGDGAAIAVDVAPDVGYIRADEGAMRRIIRSVIDHACRVEGPDGAVKVTAGSVEDGAEIAVHGNSAMLSDADIAILIRPFDVTAVDAASERAESFGFGLAVASALAAEIGGILSVMCPSEGGTRVVLRMPRALSR